MSDNITVYYNGYLIRPVTNFGYTFNPEYSNDLVVGHNYTLTIDGLSVIPEDSESPTTNDLATDMKAVKEIFSSNGGRLSISNGEGAIIVYGVNAKITNLSFNNSNDYWSRTIPFTVTIDFDHLFFGSDLGNTMSLDELAGYDEDGLADYLHSPNIVDIERSKLKEFDESFSMDITDENTKTLTLINPNVAVNSYTSIPEISQNYITNTHFNIVYNLSAVGKHIVILQDGVKTTMPAWEHAKRYVHNRLSAQINSMFSSFMSLNSSTTLDNIHNTTAEQGIFYMQDPIGGAPAFGLYNENYTFDVSESDGKYSVTYTALVKAKCPLYESHLGCSDTTIHEVKKTLAKTFNTNEETNLENQEITVSVEGSIRGLVPARQGALLSPLTIPDPGSNGGSFIVRQNTLYDKNDYAEQLLTGNVYANIEGIFDPFYYDFTERFKLALGITPGLLGVNSDVILRPSNISITRNFLEGTINYAAQYDNKYNCLESHYEMNISVDHSVPVIAEFVIPNNNVEDSNDDVCASGYNVVQQLGTYSAKKITVNINGNPGFDLGKCCIGHYDPLVGCDGTMDIFALSYFNRGDFMVPSGVIIPIIGSGYVLTNKEKRTSFPRGDFSITLEYVCGDVCELEYFDGKSSSSTG